MDAKTKQYLEQRAKNKVETLLTKEALGDRSQQVVQDIASDLFSELSTFVVSGDTIHALKNVQDKILAKGNEFSNEKDKKEEALNKAAAKWSLLATEIADLEKKRGEYEDSIVDLEERKIEAVENDTDEENNNNNNRNNRNQRKGNKSQKVVNELNNQIKSINEKIKKLDEKLERVKKEYKET